MITPEQFAEWKEHPVTKEIFALLKETKQGLLYKLENGNTLAQHADVTHGMTHRVVGHIEGINQLLNISFADADAEEDVSEVTGH